MPGDGAPTPPGISAGSAVVALVCGPGSAAAPAVWAERQACGNQAGLQTGPGGGARHRALADRAALAGPTDSRRGSTGAWALPPAPDACSSWRVHGLPRS